jgi:hypothetical protein
VNASFPGILITNTCMCTICFNVQSNALGFFEIDHTLSRRISLKQSTSDGFVVDLQMSFVVGGVFG